MSDVTQECERCGGSLSLDGRCTICGADQRSADEASSKSLAEKMDDLFAMSGKSPAKAPPAGASLINRGTNERYSLEQPVNKIGRDATNHISLTKDSYISRFHAWVLFVKGNYWVEDLGSTNGTLLNGEVLNERRQIFAGDCLKLGRTELVFEQS